MRVCGPERAPFGTPMCEQMRSCREPWIKYVNLVHGRGVER
jgi:hypothetical protein